MSLIEETASIAGIKIHPLRDTLSEEIHARQPFPLKAPARISHIALLSDETAVEQDRHHVAELCRRFGAAEPPVGINYWNVDLGAFELNWERHAEFSTFSFVLQKPWSEPFNESVYELVPKDWLAGLTGQLLAGVHIALESAQAPERSREEIEGLFTKGSLAANQLSDGAASVWTDFRTREDGFTRILIRDHSLRRRQAGRTVQRLLEIETYRMMALLALPLARQYATEITRAEHSLAELASTLTELTDLADEQALLGNLSTLAAKIEGASAATNYRFSASRAYYGIVQRRLAALRETRLQSRPTLQEFLNRRLTPAMNTCESVNERIAISSQRVARAADLLRTRIDVTIESQNRDLLSSMDRRAKLQLRLQETVEGLSVVVLSYYLVGLIGYALKAAKAAGVAIDSDLLTGLSVPLVLGGVWWAMKRVKKRLS